MMAMATTIQITAGLKSELQSLKVHEKESYEEVIWDLIEDRRELSEEAKRALAAAEEDVREGRLVPFEALKKDLDL